MILVLPSLPQNHTHVWWRYLFRCLTPHLPLASGLGAAHGLPTVEEACDDSMRQALDPPLLERPNLLVFPLTLLYAAIGYRVFRGKVRRP